MANLPATLRQYVVDARRGRHPRVLVDDVVGEMGPH